MIIVNFENEKDTYKTVRGLWQYDYGQVLRIQGGCIKGGDFG